MNIKIGDKALITLDNWFYAPDGKTYRAVHGTVKAILSSEDTLGVKTNAKSTNWYVEIGCMTVAGCQIHFVAKSDDCNFGPTEDFNTGPEGLKMFTRPSSIFNADQ